MKVCMYVFQIPYMYIIRVVDRKISSYNKSSQLSIYFDFLCLAWSTQHINFEVVKNWKKTPTAINGLCRPSSTKPLFVRTNGFRNPIWNAPSNRKDYHNLWMGHKTNETFFFNCSKRTLWPGNHIWFPVLPS